MGHKNSKKSKKESQGHMEQKQGKEQIDPQNKSAPPTPDIGKIQFAMGCYWTGEGSLGALPGVISTKAGSCVGHFETVRVYYDKKKTNPQTLQKQSGFTLVKVCSTPALIIALHSLLLYPFHPLSSLLSLNMCAHTCEHIHVSLIGVQATILTTLFKIRTNT
mmetsp:Transcript_8170/g.13231  ORF Transcript_8170/g.13231 Transcript_8170/m.13231 type:complete len:162 (-) Transcript_8170:186-671(-)